MKLKIEELLDRLLAEIDKGKSIEDCLKDYPEFSRELEPLLRLAIKIKGLPKPKPAPEVISAALEKIETFFSPGKKQVRRLSIKEIFSLRPARAIVIILLIISVGWTTLSFSSRSMPGHPLYPVKRLSEKIQHIFTFDKKGNASLHLIFSERRANELLWTFERRNRIDAGLLRMMLGEVESALRCSQFLNPGECRALLEKISRLNNDHKILLARIKTKACACDTSLIQSAINQCIERQCCIEDKLNPKSNIKQSPCPCPDR